MLQNRTHFFLLPLLFLLGTAGVWRLSALPALAESSGDLPTGGGFCYQIYLPRISHDAGMATAVQQTSVQPSGVACEEGTPTDTNHPFPDFNNDGYGDLAIGVPSEDINDGVSHTGAGAVHVIYGSATGLEAFAASAAVDDQLWRRTIAGLDETAVDAFDAFGAAIGLGDFNNDGYDDLAIGVPGSIAGGEEDAGVVQVLYGSASGLTTTDSQTWSQAHISITGAPEADDRFGASLTSGDFNDDGFADLAVGVPYEEVDGVERAGAINIIYGSVNGLTGAGDEILTQNVTGFAHSGAEENDQFGFTLEAADFDNDGIDDLAVGTPYEDNGSEYENAGSVQVFYGVAGTGLIDTTDGVVGDQHLRADSPGVDNVMEEGDRFGFSLAAGDFDNDGYADLAVGVPYETHGSGASALQHAGAVNIIFGSATGLDTTMGAPIWTQANADLSGNADAFDYFGWKLTAADFDADGFVDLAVGIPYDDTFGADFGAVQVMYSDATGPTAQNDRRLIDPITPEVNELFGIAVTAVDTNGDGYPELAIGAPVDSPAGAAAESGSVFVFHSTEQGVNGDDFQNWYQGHNGTSGSNEPNDNIGNVLP